LKVYGGTGDVVGAMPTCKCINISRAVTAVTFQDRSPVDIRPASRCK
jgi:hypothetical protein